MYNYYEAVKEDVRIAIEENYFPELITERIRIDREEFEEILRDEMWTDDSVTGNGSGSYWFSTYKAEETLAHNWNEIVTVANEFGFEPVISDSWQYGAEWWDVSIRCYYLSSAISAVLDELEEEYSENETA